MTDAKWDRRIRRANDLTSQHPFAAEGLRYYARIATFQKSLYADFAKALADSSKVSSDRPLRDELDLFLLLPKFSGFLAVVQQVAPPPLAQAAAALAQKGPPAWQQAIENFWHGDLEVPLLALGEPDDDQSARPRSFRPIVSLDFSSALRRISRRPARTRPLGWNSLDLPAVRRQTNRRRLAPRG